MELIFLVFRLKTVEESEHSDHISFDKTDSFTLSGEPKPSAQTEEPPVMSWEPSASEEELYSQP